jgi:ABC-2 type transport system permease protein
VHLGFTASFFAGRIGSGGGHAGMLGAVPLKVALRSQMGSRSPSLRIWSCNLARLVARCGRGAGGEAIAMSIIRMLGGVLPAVALAWVLYAFNPFAMGPVPVLFAVNLMAMGWWCRSAWSA